MKSASRLITIGLLLLGTLTAGAFFDPTIGRWASRDPTGEHAGVNLYAFVANDPVDSTDAMGLYKAHDHKILTKEAFDAVNLDTTPKCRERMFKTIMKANHLQDGWWPGGRLWDNVRHYNRDVQPHGNVGQGDYDKYGLPADTAYEEYIRIERMKFASSLQMGGKTGCKEALQALGRLSHSWQDFFIHAVRRDGQGGHENSHWPGWTGFGREVKGDPENRGAFYPSSFSPLASGEISGEHPGWGKEPILVSSTAEWQPRFEGAYNYTLGRFESMLPEWLGKCKCCCEH
jgi:hypothetical protein